MMSKKFINIAVITVFIVGAILGFAYSSGEQELESHIEDLKLHMEELKDKHIHCDYCKGYVYNKYGLEYSIPAIWVLTDKDTDRIVCGDCLRKAYIKGLDKTLGKPKYLKKRPKELQRD